jgi:PKD repeat protein
VLLFSLALLTACGGGGGGNGGEGSSVNTGKFIDAPTQGLNYETDTQAGTTDSQGNFRYETGEEITFAIGDVILGSTFGKSIITPEDLIHDPQDETDPTVTNILRLLQSLDEDGDPDNGIVITPAIAAEVEGRPINFAASVESFDNEEIADLFAALNAQGAFSANTPRTLRSAEEAWEHFSQTVDDPSDPTEMAALFSTALEPVIVMEPVTFDATASTGNINEYIWDFGDGTTGSGVEVSHTYSAIASYLVTLTIKDGGSKEASSTREIVVIAPPNEPPIAQFTPKPTTGQAPILISFVPTGSSDSDGEIVRYAWDFGDGKTIIGRVANHTYAEPGNYVAKLTVTDNDGATDEETFEVIITGPTPNQAPTASFTASPATGQAPLQVSFNGSASSDPDGSIASYSWNFGDGQSGSGSSKNHTYAEPGTYEARLTVKDDKGAQASTAKEIVVIEPVVDPDCSTNPCDDHATCDDSGEEIICRCNSGWTGDGFSCSMVDECENNDTLPNGGAACGLNNRGEFGQRCVDGAWKNNEDVCNDPDVCTDGSAAEGSTSCGLNDNGTLLQVCEEGQWTDADDCDDPDLCVNNTNRVGSTPCSGGYYMQLCENGQWSDTTDCALDGEDADGDLVEAGEDPNDADNTVCGDSDSDGCDDCSVSGVFDPANDGWDENGDGNCELPLDYDCMNGANAATDPYRLESCILFTYVNQDRELFAAESDNAAPLKWNEYIWEVAIAHTVDMCENVFFSHFNLSGQSPSDRAAAAGLSYGLAENIAINHDPGAAQYAFMEEPTCVGHRANVLEPRAIQAGIGYYICDNPGNVDWYGAHFVTQNFRWNFSIGASAYCQNSSNVCQVPPNPPTTAPCPGDLIAWGFCPAPSEDTLQGWCP